MADDCPICLSPMDNTICQECPMCQTQVDGSITTVDCCKKQFHTRCLTQCTTIKNECPLCRAKDCCIIQVSSPIEDVQEDRSRFVIYTIINIGMATVCIFTVLKYLLNW